MLFSIKDFSSKCDQIRSFLQYNTLKKAARKHLQLINVIFHNIPL